MDKSVAGESDDWGYQPSKGGMAIEAKLGMFIIMILVSAFGFLVFRNVDRYQQQLAGGPETPTTSPEGDPAGTLEESPGEPAAAEEIDFGDLNLAETVSDEPDPVLAFQPTEDRTVASVNDTESDLAEEWGEIDQGLVMGRNDAADEPTVDEADPFSAFDVAAAEPPAERQSTVDPDPFARDDFSAGSDTPTAQRSEEPLTDWSESAEPQLAATDSAPAIDFLDDVETAVVPQESAGIPDLPEPETSQESPVISFGLEGIPEMPEEYRQRPVPIEPEEPTLAVPDSQLPLPEAGDGWSAADDDEVLVVEDAEPAALPSAFDDDPGFEPADLQPAPTEPTEMDLAFEDSAPPIETDDEGYRSDQGFNDPRVVIREDEEPLLGLSDPADTTTPDRLDVFEQEDTFDEPSQPQLQLEPELQIEIAARDDDIESDFGSSFETPEIQPRATVDDLEFPEEHALPPISENTVEDDQQFAQFSEFPLRDAGDDAAAQLRPVTPAGGPEPERSRSSQGSSSFDVREFTYENTVVTASGEEGPCDICEVRPGDNYWRISRRMYGTSRYFSALALYNHHRVRDPKKLRPGMKILIPEAAVLEQKYPELFRDSQPKERAPSGYFVQRDGTPAYRIGEHDTLSEIAQRHLGRSSRWIQIYRLNRNVLSNPNRLKPGTVIILPDSATNVQMVP